MYDPNPRNGAEPEAATTVEVVASAVAGPPEFREEKLSEYPIFTLDRPTTLLNGQRKQLALFQADGIPVELSAVVQPDQNIFWGAREYFKSRLTSAEPDSSTDSQVPLSIGLSTYPLWPMNAFDSAAVNRATTHEAWMAIHRPPVWLEGRIKNEKAHGLGRALPGGSLDVRCNTPEGAYIPMLESFFEETPSGGMAWLPLGKARGLHAERTIISLRRVEAQSGLAWELEVAVELSNRSERSLKTTFREPIFPDWELQHSNLRGHRSGENAYDFDFVSKPHSVFTLRYRVRMPDKDVSESP